MCARGHILCINVKWSSRCASPQSNVLSIFLFYLPVAMNVFRFQFYPWLNFIFHSFKLIIVHYHTPNRGKYIYIKPSSLKGLEPQNNLYVLTQKWTRISNTDRFLEVLGILPVLITKDVVKKIAIFHERNLFFWGGGGGKKAVKKKVKQREKENAEVHPSGRV